MNHKSPYRSMDFQIHFLTLFLSKNIMRLFKLLLITFSLPILSSAQTDNNDFKIGMFGIRSMYDNSDCYRRSVTSPTIIDQDGNEINTSIFNVLKEDGFNIVFDYKYPGYYRKLPQTNSIFDLVKNNSMQIMPSVSQFYKSDSEYCNLTGYGIFNGENNHQNDCWNFNRPNYDHMFPELFNLSEFNQTIWGYHVVEEPEHYNVVNPYSTMDWNFLVNNPDLYDREKQIDVVENGIEYFRSLKMENHKLIQMHAMHNKSITPMLQHDDTGPLTAVDFINMENKCDVFFEGSYSVPLLQPNFYELPYSDIFNIGFNNEVLDPINFCNTTPNWNQTDYLLNNKHFLGFLESIEYGKSEFNEVHKVISAKCGDHDLGTNIFNTDINIDNGNWLYFQAYSSIIHGVNGIWFFAFDNMFLENEQSQNSGMGNGEYLVDNFKRQNFPIAYNDYLSKLTRELGYLNSKGFLNQKKIVTSKTNTEDNHCIVQLPSSYDILVDGSWQSGASVLNNDHQSENYALRYSIRESNDEVIMIISNVLPYSLKTSLDFNSFNNSTVQLADEYELLFEKFDPRLYFNSDLGDGFTPNNYKVDIEAVDVNGQLNFQPFSSDFIDLQIPDLTFGPFDTHIISFKKPSDANCSVSANGWNTIWSNNGNGLVSTVEISSDHQLLVGDFDISNNAKEELLAIQKYNSDAWATISSFNENENLWDFVWSNGGNGRLKSTPGGVGITSKTRFLAGNFLHAEQDEVLSINYFSNGNNWSTITRYDPSTVEKWVWSWSSYGSNYLQPGSNTWELSPNDEMIPFDFDSDGYDELFVVRRSTPVEVSILKFDQQTHEWTELWSNENQGNGLGFIDDLEIFKTDEFFVGNFQIKKKDRKFPEIVVFRNGNPDTHVQVLHFNGNGTSNGADPFFEMGQNNNGASNFEGKSLPLEDTKVLVGNIDQDIQDEILFIRRTSWIGQAISMDMNNLNKFTWRWSNNSTPTINDWCTIQNGYDLDYELINYDTSNQSSLLALSTLPKDDCQLVGNVSLLRSQVGTNKDQDLTVKEDDHVESLLYPNPTNGVFKINNRTNVLRVFDSTGKLVLTLTDIDANSDVDLSALEKGIYYLEFDNTNGAKLIIE